MNTPEKTEINNHAIKWISENKDKIKSRSLKAVMTSPYDMDDFIQMAYCAAVKVIKNSLGKQDDLKKQFWQLYWSEMQVMTRRSVPTYTCGDKIDDLSRNPAGGSCNKLNSPRDSEIFQAMSLKQSETWRELLTPGCHTSCDAADSLAVMDKGVRAAKRRGTRHTARIGNKYRQSRG